MWWRFKWQTVRGLINTKCVKQTIKITPNGYIQSNDQPYIPSTNGNHSTIRRHEQRIGVWGPGINIAFLPIFYTPHPRVLGPLWMQTEIYMILDSYWPSADSYHLGVGGHEQFGAVGDSLLALSVVPWCDTHPGVLGTLRVKAVGMMQHAVTILRGMIKTNY